MECPASGNGVGDEAPHLPQIPKSPSPPAAESSFVAQRSTKAPGKRRPSVGKKTVHAGGARTARRAVRNTPAKRAKAAVNRSERWAVLFESLDTSGDHELDKQEFLVAVASWTESCPRIHESDLDDFSEWDSDGNGTICEGEFFCFCDALFQILGEREFQELEAQAVELAKGGGLSPKATRQANQGADATPEAPQLEEEAPAEWAPLVQQAAEKLRECMKDVGGKDGRKVLRKAINEARSAGVDRQLVDDALQLVRKIEVEEVLQRAMDSKNPKLLKVAIQNVKTMGVGEDLLHQAESLLGQMEARESITCSIATKDPVIVKAAIARAEQAGVEDSEVEPARKIAKLLTLRNQLDAALEASDEKKLVQLIHGMENDNIQDPMLEEAQRALPIVRKAVEARRNLKKVICTGTKREMMEVIDEAEKCSVPQEEIERARRILRKEEAREDLMTAIGSEKRGSLLHAIAEAGEFDVDMPEIDIAQKVLKKLDASRDISLALSRGPQADVKVLRELVTEAKTWGVESHKIEKAEELIAELERAELERARRTI